MVDLADGELSLLYLVFEGLLEDHGAEKVAFDSFGAVGVGPLGGHELEVHVVESKFLNEFAYTLTVQSHGARTNQALDR